MQFRGAAGSTHVAFGGRTLAASDGPAVAFKHTKREVVHQAKDRFPEKFDDYSVAAEQQRDPSDPVLNWKGRREVPRSG